MPPIRVYVSAAANKFLPQIVRCRWNDVTQGFVIGCIQSREDIVHSGLIGADRRHCAGRRVIMKKYGNRDGYDK